MSALDPYAEHLDPLITAQSGLFLWYMQTLPAPGATTAEQIKWAAAVMAVATTTTEFISACIHARGLDPIVLGAALQSFRDSNCVAIDQPDMSLASEI